jgi:hypothetical protein
MRGFRIATCSRNGSLVTPKVTLEAEKVSNTHSPSRTAMGQDFLEVEGQGWCWLVVTLQFPQNGPLVTAQEEGDEKAHPLYVDGKTFPTIQEVGMGWHAGGQPAD